MDEIFLQQNEDGTFSKYEEKPSITIEFDDNDDLVKFEYYIKSGRLVKDFKA